MFLSLSDVKGGVHEAYSNPFVEWFDDTGLESNILKVDLCCELRLGLVTCRKVSTRVLGLFEEQC